MSCTAVAPRQTAFLDVPASVEVRAVLTDWLVRDLTATAFSVLAGARDERRFVDTALDLVQLAPVTPAMVQSPGRLAGHTAACQRAAEVVHPLEQTAAAKGISLRRWERADRNIGGGVDRLLADEVVDAANTARWAISTCKAGWSALHAVHVVEQYLLDEVVGADHRRAAVVARPFMTSYGHLLGSLKTRGVIG